MVQYSTSFFQATPQVRRFLFSLAVLLIGGISVLAQGTEGIIQRHLDALGASGTLSRADVNDWTITSQHTSRQSGVTHVYIRQQVDGIPVSNGVANFAIRHDQVVHMGNRLIPNLDKNIRSRSPKLSPEAAIHAAAMHLQLETPADLRQEPLASANEFLFSPGNVSQEAIPVRLMYFAVDDHDVRLVWDLSIYTKDGQHWWSLRVDAQTGELIYKNDWISHCRFESQTHTTCQHEHRGTNETDKWDASAMLEGSGQYTVYPLPVESPIHGARTTLVNPADPIASPFGWHDTDGIDGAEHTITRGNNVYSYEDKDDDNEPGYSPDGTGALNFSFPLFAGDHPFNYLDGAIAQLFYMNNMLHDVWYQYGFDEVSGNFQDNNYGLGGIGADYVRAEAQDGGGLNNANFGTPPDGNRPRMQMYIWEAEKPLGNYFDVLAPDTLAGLYESTYADFGPDILYAAISGEIAVIEDDVAPSGDGCDSILNAAQLAGKLVMINRGGCPFVEKTQAAQDAGAIGVIFVSTLDGSPTGVSGSSTTITIPSVMISKADGDRIKARLAQETVIGTIHHDGTYDSSLDNGIIAHEYGHGISNRLTGGPDNTDCLRNAEQMGEGWSDWVALMMTMEPGDKGTDVRGIATYTKGEPITGQGLRPAPYSTDFDVNPYTYAASNDAGSISQPHGVGFIFATALWDLNWALIDAYGGSPDPDIMGGQGGNNIAMQLVIEGMKLQPCGPGMIDGRDAILLADRLLYEGAHQCLIWEVFARRGFGESANQGSADSRTDQVEAFDIPTVCQTATEAPKAAFSFVFATDCSPIIKFKDLSTSVPQSWFWDFGDGITSTERHPTHQYEQPGFYSVKLVVSNTIGIDSFLLELNPYGLPPAPQVPDLEICAGETVYVPAPIDGPAVWRNMQGEIVYVGDILLLENVDSLQIYSIEEIVFDTVERVGPFDSSVGDGGYHGTGYYGAVNFTAENECEILSAWVDAQGAGPRTFTIARGTNADGEAPHDTLILQQVTVDLADGPQRIQLNMHIPGPGDYHVGGSFSESTALFRNNTGATYPYVIPGFITLTSSSANSNPELFYYYLYDLEVKLREEPCVSERDTFTVAPVVSQFSYVENGFTVEFIDESIDAHTWFWTFGDGNTSTLQHPIHTYDEPGDYLISLTINNGACTSQSVFSLLTGINEVDEDHSSMTLRPNPARGNANLVFAASVDHDLKIEILDLHGRILKKQIMPSGKNELALEIAGLPPSVYFIRATGQDKIWLKKLAVE